MNTTNYAAAYYYTLPVMLNRYFQNGKQWKEHVGTPLSGENIWNWKVLLVVHICTEKPTLNLLSLTQSTILAMFKPLRSLAMITWQMFLLLLCGGRLLNTIHKIHTIQLIILNCPIKNLVLELIQRSWIAKILLVIIKKVLWFHYWKAFLFLQAIRVFRYNRIWFYCVSKALPNLTFWGNITKFSGHSFSRHLIVRRPNCVFKWTLWKEQCAHQNIALSFSQSCSFAKTLHKNT